MRESEPLANVETLINEITDPTLRERLAVEVGALKKRTSWGLVFERHLPESVRLLDAPIRVGSVVWERRSTRPRRYRVRGVEGDELIAVAEPAKTTTLSNVEPIRLARSGVMVEKDFADPIFPAFESIGAIRRGPSERPSQVVIEGENYHTLEALQATYQGQVDLIYIDPPYNTGARDWSYNNDYVDINDRWRPSKWLAFMERRLRLGMELLKPDGVVVISIDENMHAPLVMLLGQLFPAYDITSVAMVHNPRGIRGDNFSYCNDFAVFVIPKGIAAISRRELDDDEPNRMNLRKWGGISERSTSRNCFYPVLVRGQEILAFGDVPADDFHPSAANVERADGVIEIWPLDPAGVERKWRYARQSVVSSFLKRADSGVDGYPHTVHNLSTCGSASAESKPCHLANRGYAQKTNRKDLLSGTCSPGPRACEKGRSARPFRFVRDDLQRPRCTSQR